MALQTAAKSVDQWSKNWFGPYVIVKRINDLVYRIPLTDRCKPMVVHRYRLRRYYIGENMTLVTSIQNCKDKGDPSEQERRSKRERRPRDRFKF